jgi:hypothetical protein
MAICIYSDSESICVGRWWGCVYVTMEDRLMEMMSAAGGAVNKPACRRRSKICCLYCWPARAAIPTTYVLSGCNRAPGDSDSETALFEGARASSNRLHCVLQVLPSSLLGAVFGFVCHNTHKQQPLHITQTWQMKCSSEVEVKTKRPELRSAFLDPL